jgi:hypothetical protein
MTTNQLRGLINIDTGTELEDARTMSLLIPDTGISGSPVSNVLTISGGLVVTDLAPISGNFLTTDVNGKVVDSGIDSTTLADDYVNVTGDTMTGTLTISGGEMNLPDLITTEENVAQIDSSGDIITTELQELYVPVEDVTGPNATGTKGQWSYGLGFYYKCIATNTWIKYTVITTW